MRGASDPLDATLGRRADVVEALAGQSRSRRQQVTGLPPPSWRVQQPPPGDAGGQLVDDAGQRVAVIDTRATAIAGTAVQEAAAAPPAIAARRRGTLLWWPWRGSSPMNWRAAEPADGRKEVRRLLLLPSMAEPDEVRSYERSGG